MIVNPRTGSVLCEGSMVFYGFRFNVNTENNAFDFDNYLINQEDALASLGCIVHIVDAIIGEYCVTLENVCTVAIPELGWISRKFSTREISEDEITKMQQFAAFFNIPYQTPEWRHALVTVPIANFKAGQIPEAEQNKPKAEE